MAQERPALSIASLVGLGNRTKYGRFHLAVSHLHKLRMSDAARTAFKGSRSPTGLLNWQMATAEPLNGAWPDGHRSPLWIVTPYATEMVLTQKRAGGHIPLLPRRNELCGSQPTS